MNIYLHSYTFREQSFETACEAAKKFGWDGIELSRVHFQPDRLGQELPRCIETAAEAEIPVTCVDYAADLIAEDRHVRDESLRQLELDIRTCAENGVFLMNGFVGTLVGEDPENFGDNGSALAGDAHFERAGDCLRHLGAVADGHGVTLTLEVHMNTIHDTIRSTARLLDLVDHPTVLANPDPGNMFATSSAEKDVEALDQLADRLGYFHFKNCRRGPKGWDYSVCLDEGEIDTPAHVRKLLELGYNGPVCIEYCGSGDPRVSAEKDIAYMKRCVEAVDENRT